MPSKPPRALEPAPRAAGTQGSGSVDQPLLDRAVEYLNGLHNQKALELVVATGEYLINQFFGGTISQLKDINTHVTWRALAAHEGLQMSHSQLWYSVAIVAQLKQLPAGVGAALSLSHHRRLIALKEPAEKQKLAEKAAAETWTVQRLESEIAKQRSKTSEGRRGRPTLPVHIKALRRLTKLVAPLADHAVTVRDVALLGENNMAALQAELQRQIATLIATSDEITAALEAHRAKQ